MDDATLPPPAAAASPRTAPPAAKAARPPRQFSLEGLTGWFQRNPVDGLLVVGTFALIFGFYLFYKSFSNGNYSALTWLWSAWNAENDFEHGKLSVLVIPVLLFLLRDKLWVAAKGYSGWGIPVLIVGMLLYLLSVRMLQPRVAIGALPILLTGVTLIFWGRQVAKLLLFPFFFFYLMVPVPGLQQATSFLQLVISGTVAGLVGGLGVDVEAVGTTLTAAGQNGFTFEIADGCSGVRSLMAMTMITALYVYFTQNRLWKQVAIFGASLAFAVVGNIGRVTSIILIARYVNQDFASGMYHDWSSLVIFFPLALLSMVGFAHVVNLDWPALFRRLKTYIPQPAEPVAATAGSGDPREKSSQDKY